MPATTDTTDTATGKTSDTGTSPSAASRARAPQPEALRMLTTVHTVIWLAVESCVVYVLYSGVVRRSDRRAAVAGAVVAGESLVFLANGARCPLTDMAVRFGGEAAHVTDIYLPKRIARNLPAIHVPLVLAAVLLHGRNLRRKPSRAAAGWRGITPRS